VPPTILISAHGRKETNMNSRALAAVLFGLMLVGCGGAAPPANRVVVTGADIKFGDPASAFTAVVQDSSNVTVGGKTFTWTSSNTDVATVDANGTVTPKHVGAFKISATSEGIVGESASFRIYGLDMIGGVAKYSDAPSDLYFETYARVLLPGTAATPDGSISLTGPAAWNSGTGKLTIQFGGTNAQAGFIQAWIPSVVTGDYQATTTVNGQTFTKTFSVNKSSTLEYPSVSLSAVSTSSVTISWAAVANAERYLVGVNPNGLGGVKSVLTTQALTATLNGTPVLDAAKTYRAFVQASNFNPEALPGQLNSALQYVPVVF
jgi:hypothetical protein